jgi:hypothetical protein
MSSSVVMERLRLASSPDSMGSLGISRPEAASGCSEGLWRQAVVEAILESTL